MRDDLRVLLPRLLRDDRCAAEYRNAVDHMYDKPHDWAKPLYDVANFTNMELCNGNEIIWSMIAITKTATLPPLPARNYRDPGALYNAVAVMAPSGSAYHKRVVDGMTNVHRRLATSSSQRLFRPFEPRQWDAGDPFEDEVRDDSYVELFFSSPKFHRRKDILDGRIGGKVMDFPPAYVDTNGQMAGILRSKRHLCFTDDNLVVVSDASSSLQPSVTSGDSVVPGQLVLVTFSLRGIYKPTKGKVNFRKHKPTQNVVVTEPKWFLQPTLRSITILSKLGPLIIDEMRSLDRRADGLAATAAFVEQSRTVSLRRVDDAGDIARELKRLRLGPSDGREVGDVAESEMGP